MADNDQNDHNENDYMSDVGDNDNDDDYVIMLVTIMTTTTGVYYCRADNPVGSVTGSVSLIVHGELNHHMDHHIYVSSY